MLSVKTLHLENLKQNCLGVRLGPLTFPSPLSPFSPPGQGDAVSLNKGQGEQRGPRRDEPGSFSPTLPRPLPLRQGLGPGLPHCLE